MGGTTVVSNEQRAALASLSPLASGVGAASPTFYPVLRSLLYFDDAEAKATLPRGLSPAGWAAIKLHFERTVPPLLRSCEL